MITIRVKSPTDLIAVTAKVLGFMPDDSLVLLGLGDAPFHARIDMPRTTTERQLACDALVGAVRRNPLTSLCLIAFTDDAEVAGAAFAEMEGLLDMPVQLTMRVHDGRYFTDEESEGQPYDLADHPFLEGVLESRAALERSIQPDEALIATIEPRVETLLGQHYDAIAGNDPRWLYGMARWVQTVFGQQLEVNDEDKAFLIVLLNILAVRDVAWTTIDRSNAKYAVGLLGELVRSSSPAMRANLAGLLAFAAWMKGDGALAWVATDVAFEIKPDHTMTQLVAAVLEGAMSPDHWTPFDTESLEVLQPPID